MATAQLTDTARLRVPVSRTGSRRRGARLLAAALVTTGQVIAGLVTTGLILIGLVTTGLVTTSLVLAGPSPALASPALASPAGASSAAADGRYDENEPVTALANPSTVFLQATFTGVVRDRRTGAMLDPTPIVLRRTCSGVVINPAGYAVTTSLCVAPGRDVLLANALNVEARTRVVRGGLTQDQLAAFVADRLKTTEFTGTGRRHAPAVTVQGWLDGYRGRDDDDQAVKASVAYAQPITGGDVAVVKLNRTGLPAVEIVPDDVLQEGQTVVLAGYYGDGQPEQAYTLRNRVTTVAGRDGTNRLTVAAGIGPQASGGAVVDRSGRLLALQDADTTTDGQPVRDLLKASHILRALTAAKVTATIGDTDREYRAALQDYFAGRFSQAAARFEALLADAPGYRPAQTYRDEAVERRDVDGDAIADAADWPMYALSVGAGVAILALLHGLGRWRRTAAAGPAEPVPADTWRLAGDAGLADLAGPADVAEPADLPGPADAAGPDDMAGPDGAPDRGDADAGMNDDTVILEVDRGPAG